MTKFQRLLTGKPQRFKLLELPLSEPWNFLIAVDPERVQAMTPDRRDNPIFGIVTATNELFIIDGYHRIERRRQDGFTTIQCWVMPSRMVPMIREWEL